MSNASHLLEVIHPTQREREDINVRGRLIASTLPDGSRLASERNGQQQVIAIERLTIQPPWLRWLGCEQTLTHVSERNLVGLQSFTKGNCIQALNGCAGNQEWQ